MRHVLPILACSLLLAACGSHQGNPGPSSATPAPASTASGSNQAAAASSAAPATSSPAAASTAAAPATAPAGAATSAAAPGDGGSSGLTPAELAKARAIYQRGLGKWTEGKQYFAITPPQPKATGTSKVEVTEVFSFGCPFCNEFHKVVDNMAKALPAYAQMDYLPASFNPVENWPVYQRAYFAAQTLGLARKSYDAVFNATWKSGELATYNLGGRGLKPHSDWPKIADFARFYAKKYGVDAKQFIAVANSFSVNLKMKRADELIKSYGVASTPTFVINGMYRFNFASAGGVAQANELVQWLAAKAALNK